MSGFPGLGRAGQRERPVDAAAVVRAGIGVLGGCEGAQCPLLFLVGRLERV